MVQPAHGTRSGFWRSVRELPGRSPLRVKLITAVLALVAIALVVISVAGLSFLRSFLLGQADNQLSNLVTQAQNHNLRFGESGLAPEPWSADFVSGGTVSSLNPPFSISGVSGPQISIGAPWLSETGHPVTVAAQSGGGRWRVVAWPAALDGTSGTLVMGLDVTSQYDTLGKLAAVDVAVAAATLIALGALGTTVVRRSLRPLDEIEQTAGAIAAGDLSRRVPERDPGTEMGRLGRSLNAMLSQIETAFRSQAQSEEAARQSAEKMRQFLADASHELRTPLTAIRGFAEYYRQRGGVATGENGGRLTPPDLDRIMRRVEQESARMGVLVEDMLLLARLDQQRPLEERPVDLLTLAADAVHDARVVAPGRDIELKLGSRGAMLVTGDEVRLRQVIGNLMTNALVHTPDGTPVEVLIRSGTLAEAPPNAIPKPLPPPPPPPMDEAGWPDQDWPDGQDGWSDDARPGRELAAQPGARAGYPWPSPSRPAVILQVIDHGQGLTADQAEHVFERFYRADLSRTSGGTGLGLAIVAALVAAHGGLTWVESEPGQGATFSIALPQAPDAVDGGNDEDADAGSGFIEDDPYHDTESYQALDQDEWVRLHSRGS